MILSIFWADEMSRTKGNLLSVLQEVGFFKAENGKRSFDGKQIAKEISIIWTLPRE